MGIHRDLGILGGGNAGSYQQRDLIEATLETLHFLCVWTQLFPSFQPGVVFLLKTDTKVGVLEDELHERQNPGVERIFPSRGVAWFSEGGQRPGFTSYFHAIG